MCLDAKRKPNPHTTAGVPNHLNVTFWNIHGHKSKLIGNKLSDNEFVETFRDDHIVGLVELHMDSTPSIQGFKLIKQKIRKKIHKGPKISGGLALFVRSEYAHLVKPIQNENDDSIWVQLRKEDTGDGVDTYIGTLYLSPGRDEKSRDDGIASLESFFQEVREFRSKGKVFLQGDFNAHTGNLPDFIVSDKSDEDLGIENDDKPLIRNSEDKKPVNERGEIFFRSLQSIRHSYN